MRKGSPTKSQKLTSRGTLIWHWRLHVHFSLGTTNVLFIFQTILLLIHLFKNFDAIHVFYFTLKIARNIWGKDICIILI